MSSEAAFKDLMARLRGGDEQAAREVFQRFADRLINLARSRLDARIRQKVDPEEVIQSAFLSFFQRHAQAQFAPDSWDGLGALLPLIPLRKCGHKVEHSRAARRSVLREMALPNDDSDAGPSWEGLAREPTPAEA